MFITCFVKGGISLAINKSRQECFLFLNPCRKDFVVALLNSNCRFSTVDGVAIDLCYGGGIIGKCGGVVNIRGLLMLQAISKLLLSE